MHPLKVTIAIPIHWMHDWQFFLVRCLKSIEKQTYDNYEIVLTHAGSMPVNSNRAIKAANGDIVKVLYMDDYLAHPDALKDIVEAFSTTDARWLVTACTHDLGDGNQVTPHDPHYSDDIHTGNNTIGSPSVLAMRADSLMFFDEELSWLLDCDLYRRLHELYGNPALLLTPNVVIGLHNGQTSNLMATEDKLKERDYLNTKYGK